MPRVETIAVVAHDAKKNALVDWIQLHHARFAGRRIVATGTTGRMIKDACPDLAVVALKSGPLGGDQQLGSMIANGELDILVFFTDPMTPMPHVVDVKALTRLAVLYDVATACNQSTADFIIHSPLFEEGYQKQPPDVSAYVNRAIP